MLIIATGVRGCQERLRAVASLLPIPELRGPAGRSLIGQNAAPDGTEEMGESGKRQIEQSERDAIENSREKKRKPRVESHVLGQCCGGGRFVVHRPRRSTVFTRAPPLHTRTPWRAGAQNPAGF